MTAIAKRIRRRIIEMTTAIGEGHVTSCFSCLEILLALFEGGFIDLKTEPGRRNKLVMSKGHGALALYCILDELGALKSHRLADWCKPTSPLGLHLSNIPETGHISGSLGQGIGMAVGMAMADQTKTVYCLAGDAELHEGSCWESLRVAASKNVCNFRLIVDMNGRGVLGTLDVDGVRNGPCGDVQEQLSAFGIPSFWLDGHDIVKMKKLFLLTGYQCFVCETIKGKGVSFLEDADGWHSVALDEKQAQAALEELR